MGEVFDGEIQARYRDVNTGGHVDNVEAIRVLDEARTQFFRFAPLGLPAGVGLLARVPGGVSELMGSQRVDYHAEMRFAPYQPFLVRIWLAHVGRSSFTISSEVRVERDHPPAVVAESSLVFWDHAAQASWAISPEVRADLDRFRGDRVALRERPGP